MNLVVGSIIGLLVGLAIETASFTKVALQRLSRANQTVKSSNALAAGLLLSFVTGALLYFLPRVFQYTLGVIREAEKVPHLTYRLLNHERLAVYLTITALLISCSIVWAIARASRELPRLVRRLWLLSLVFLIAAGYYVDSRIEVQLYEPSLHRSMFLLVLTLSMALVGSLPFSNPRYRAVASRARGVVQMFAAAILFAALAFTFARFDKNQNLK